jgi:hypothetical protein
LIKEEGVEGGWVWKYYTVAELAEAQRMVGELHQKVVEGVGSDPE